MKVSFKQSIFFRIYAGLVALIVIVAIFAYILIQLINNQRAQDYRESMADGVAYVVSQVVARQPTEKAQQEWLNDVSKVLELPLTMVDVQSVDFSRSENGRLNDGHAVVRYDAEQTIADIYVRISGVANKVLQIHVDKLSEAQIKMIPILILEDLAYYAGNEEQRLKELQPYFPYQLSFRPLSELKLDRDQLSRLRVDKTQTILLYRDSGTTRGTTISAVSAYTNQPNTVLVLGPMSVFNWLPFQLVAGVIVFSLFMLSLGVYFLMRPLQHKIGKVRLALNQVRRGDLDTRVDVEGYDEIANLGLSFNMMTEHIQRLIEAQQELTRAVSHELRTPVARIRFGVEMLAETEELESRYKQTEMIDQDIEALNSLIDEILTYAKLEQGTPSLNFTEVSIRNVLEQIIKDTDVIKGNKIITSDLPDENCIAIAEYRYLHRVVQNFVGNALRHCNQRIHVSGGIIQQQAFVCVEDDGEGIAEKDRQKVFEAFARLDDSRTRASGDRGGYGLGLSIVSRIAYWFGGSVAVDDSPTLGGARFIMKWPITQLSLTQMSQMKDDVSRES